MGHRPPVKGGYFPVPRSIRCTTSGRRCASPWNRWASKSRCTITRSPPPAERDRHKFETLVKRADWLQILKYCVTTRRTPTARPRPSCRSRSSATTARACTSTNRCGRAARTSSPVTATRACRNSHLHRRRDQAREGAERDHQPGHQFLQAAGPGFEAPINLAYSARNRSAAIRIPYVSNPKGRRIEVRFPIRPRIRISRSRRC